MRNSLWLVLVLLTGCALAPRNVVVTADDKIYTLPAGQQVSLLLDKKPVNMTFQTPMVVSSADTFIACQEKLNNAQLDKTAAKKVSSTWLGIIGSLLSLIVAGLFAWKKIGTKPPSK